MNNYNSIYTFFNAGWKEQIFLDGRRRLDDARKCLFESFKDFNLKTMNISFKRKQENNGESSSL